MTGLVRKTGLKIYVLWYSPFAQKILASFPNFYKTVEKKRGLFDAATYPYWHMKVARYNFSGSIPAKFEHKLRRHKQTFGKIATTVVLDKDENLSWSGLQWDRSCHSNEMTPLPIILGAIFLTGNCSYKIVHVICYIVIEIFWDEVFIVRNTVKKRKLLMFGRYLKKTKRFWHAISLHSSFNLFKNVCEISWR